MSGPGRSPGHAPCGPVRTIPIPAEQQYGTTAGSGGFGASPCQDIPSRGGRRLPCPRPTLPTARVSRKRGFQIPFYTPRVSLGLILTDFSHFYLSWHCIVEQSVACPVGKLGWMRVGLWVHGCQKLFQGMNFSLPLSSVSMKFKKLESFL